MYQNNLPGGVNTKMKGLSFRARLLPFAFAAVLAASGAALAETVIPTDWTSVTGGWELQLVNADQRSANTNVYAAVDQSGGRLVYEWTVRFESTTFSLGPAAGMHIMADDGASDVRGNSYLVFQDAEFIRLYKAQAGRLNKVADLPAKAAVGETHSYRVEYHSDSGRMEIYRNGELAGEWTDSAPLKDGKFISVRTNGTIAVFSNIAVTSE